MAASELRLRIVSGVLLAALVLGITVASATGFALLCAVGAVQLLREWHALTRGFGRGWLPLGLCYAFAGMGALVALRMQGVVPLLLLFALVWGSDTVAYLVGKRFGKHKIIPRISPGKSWEGLAGAMVFCACVPWLFAHGTGQGALPLHPALATSFALLGLAGDLFESWLKRRAGVKDSGRLIPGHGGLFDRVDALLPCAIYALACIGLR